MLLVLEKKNFGLTKKPWITMKSSLFINYSCKKNVHLLSLHLTNWIILSMSFNIAPLDRCHLIFYTFDPNISKQNSPTLNSDIKILFENVELPWLA